MKKLLLITCLSILIFNSIFAQDTIWLLNGQKHELTNYTIDQKLRKLFYENKKGKEKFFHVDHIFSITENNGKEQIYYTPRRIDTTLFTVENMKDYLTGFDDSENEYKTRLATSSGFAVGGFSAFAFSVPFYAVIPVAAYSTIFGLTKPSKKNIQKKHPEYANNDFYIDGYRESATGKRTWNTIKGAFVGIIVGVTTSIIVHNN